MRKMTDEVLVLSRAEMDKDIWEQGSSSICSLVWEETSPHHVAIASYAYALGNYFDPPSLLARDPAGESIRKGVRGSCTDNEKTN
jgi:hypothetical protein